MSEEQQTNTKKDWKSLEMGGLWSNTSESSGEKYLTGYFKHKGEQVKIIVFKNKHKQEGEKSPDLRIYLDTKTAAVSNSEEII